MRLSSSSSVHVRFLTTCPDSSSSCAAAAAAAFVPSEVRNNLAEYWETALTLYVVHNDYVDDIDRQSKASEGLTSLRERCAAVVVDAICLFLIIILCVGYIREKG